MAVIMMLILLGMVIPITGVVLALLWDVGVLAWALYRTWGKRWMPKLVGLAARLHRPHKLTAPAH